ncbi:hypothetical protein E2542_SST12609 [Spatholobus suberectus]|nr:hypothetical protein E2542_SST12609 [Spatholobus suberectus]
MALSPSDFGLKFRTAQIVAWLATGEATGDAETGRRGEVVVNHRPLNSVVGPAPLYIKSSRVALVLQKAEQCQWAVEHWNPSP